MVTDIAIVGLYLLALIIIGLRGGNAIKNATDFTASDKRYGSLVMFATLSASFVGGGYSTGNAAASFENGIGTALTLLGFSMGMILVGAYLVKGVDRFPNARTVGDVIGSAYGRVAHGVTGIFSYLCCAGVVGAQMSAIGLVFHTLLGISPQTGTLLGCGVVLLYTTFGGLQSVITADIIQFVLMAAGMPLLLVTAIDRIGGINEFVGAIPDGWLHPLNGMSLPAFIALFFSMMCGEALAPPYMQRLLIGKSTESTAKGTIWSGLFSVPFFLVTAGVGVAARVLAVTDTAEQAMPQLILTILPVGLRGLMMAAMVSIILSAADGFLNGASVSLVCDTVLVLRPSLSDKAQLFWLRVVNALTGFFAMCLSFAIPHIFSVLLLAYSFWSPAVLVPLAAALLGVRADGKTFCVSVFVGCVVSLLWNTVWHQPFGMDGCLAGILANLIVFCIGVYRYTHRSDALVRLSVR